MSGTGEQGSEGPEGRGDDRILCHCMNVTAGTVRRTIEIHRCRRVEDVTALCRAGGGCRTCWPEIEELLAAARRARRGVLKRLFRKE